MTILSDLLQKRAGFNTVYDLISVYGKRVDFTAGTLTPSAGTVTGGTKLGYYSELNDMCFFSIDIAGWTQNTSAATTYTIPLPIAAVSTRRMQFTAQDRSSSIVLIASTETSSSLITIRKAGGATWAAAGGVNIVLSGFYWTA